MGLSYDEAASKLYELTQDDWHTRVDLILTEPCCAFVDVFSDNKDLPGVRGFIGTDDANESIRLACEYVIEKGLYKNPNSPNE